MSIGFSVGDFLAVGQLAWTLYRECYLVAKGAPHEFQLLVGEISTLSSSLKMLQEEVNNPDSILRRAGDDRVRMVNEMVARIRVTLEELQKVAKKHKMLGEESKRRIVWEKFKWSIESKSIDSLRSKLVYHNGIMSLLLSSIGNSSLNRIESSSRALQTDITEIKGYIKSSSEKTEANQSSTVPLLSVIDDEVFQISLSAALMENAETIQPWKTIGVNQWIHAGKWWLLKSQLELYAPPISDQVAPPSAYVSLLKAFWILNDIITCHPQLPFLNSSTDYEVKHLSAELKTEFRRIKTLNLAVPDWDQVEKQNLQIWETRAQGSILRPGNRLSKSDISQSSGTFWEVKGEQIFFQKFASYRRNGLKESSACVILFLIHETTHMARVIAQDQSGIALVEITLQPELDARAEGSSIVINSENITFSSQEDAQFFCSVIEAAKLYLFHRNSKCVNFKDFEAFIIINAVKNECKNELMRLLKNHNSSGSSLEGDNSKNALAIALALASQFVKHESKDTSINDSEDESSQFSLLYWAVKCGHTAVVQWLMVEGVKGENGFTALHLAVQMEKSALLQHLLGSNIVELEVKDTQDGQTPLLYAVRMGNGALVRLLLEKGADIESKDTKNGRTPLIWAVEERNKALTQLILDKGANIESKDTKYGHPPLLCAVMRDDEVLVRLLLDKGADVESKDRVYSHTPLIWAARNGYKEMVQLLLDKGAVIESRDIEYGQTPLIWAVQCRQELVVQVLLHNGADIESRDTEFSQTPLIWAVINWDKALVQLLLDKGADIESKNSFGRTPLSCAAGSGQTELVKLLTENGADVDTKDDSGRTSLWWAVVNSKKGVVKVLVELGADVNSQPNIDSGGSPLWEAEQLEDKSLFQLLKVENRKERD